MMRSTSLLAAVTTGSVAAIFAAVASLALESPDAVLFNPLTVGVGAFGLGMLAVGVWLLLARVRQGRVLFAGIWVLGALAVSGLAVVGSSLLSGLAAFVVPLAVLCFAVTGVLSVALPARVARVRWAPLVSLLLAMGVLATTSRAASPRRSELALPPTAPLSPVAASVPTTLSAGVQATPSAAVPSAVAVAVRASAVAAPSPSAAPRQARVAGQYAGVNFQVGQGSKATFTVGEQLARMPVTNDAVVEDTALAGELHLDGRPSTITMDVQRLKSDQTSRDRYIKTSMFPNDQYASFTTDNPGAFPEGTPRGQTVTGHTEGTLTLKGGTAPLAFDWEGRDDGDVFYLLGRTKFTWKDIGVDPPNSASIVQINDTVSVEIMLAARPK